nr:C-C motif chemokine 20 [Nothobranchius furzeri]XP_054595104.1 C-C motif chemokine 20 [Nothobranchius furzeri]
MTPRGITMATVLLFFAVGMLGPTPAACSRLGKACCTRYNRKPVPFTRIKGYREQTAQENCRIEAIIFYTINHYEVCATKQDEWVKNALLFLSTKLKKMSKANPDERESITNAEGISNENDMFFNTITGFQHSNGNFD